MQSNILYQILNKKIVAILRGFSYDENMFIMESLIDSDITNFEITLNTESALDIIKDASNKFEDKALVGAGTVTNLKDSQDAIKAGAKFLICPNLSEEAIKYSLGKNVLIIPGVLTPTEIFKAKELGCQLVKLFPASAMGPDYIKQLKAPFNDLKIMAVGGINVDTIPDYIKNGADAFGIGSSLFPKEIVKERNKVKLIETFNNFKSSLK